MLRFQMRSLLTVAIAAALATGAMHLFQPDASKASLSMSNAVSLSARPGTAVVVPFRQLLSDGGLELLSYVEGRPVLEPALQGGAQVIFSSIHFVGSAATGELLLRVADDRRLPIEFSLSATGDGVGADGQPAPIAALPIDVRIAIDQGTTLSLPGLKGLWSNALLRWEFEYPRPGMLTVHNVGESPKHLTYQLFPMASGELALVASSLSERTALRLNIDGEFMSVAPLVPDSSPLVELRKNES